ncbi:MAG: ParB/RepB/Spo0J family partition protein [Oligoflexales bacterium]|nr:ParB/RepB/Spo0J family partition protein [Oligoflexales bacterium]
MPSERQGQFEKQLKGKININESKKVSDRIKALRNALAKEQVVKLDPFDIQADENIRRKIDKESMEFQQLVQSIKDLGVLQSIVVEYKEVDGQNCILKCIAGHRRLEALKESGLRSKIPARLCSGDKGEALRVALTENVIRKNLHYIEVADTYKAIRDVEELTSEEISKKFDKSEKTVDRYLKVADWDAEIKNLIFDNKDLFPFRFINAQYLEKSKKPGEVLNSIKKKIEAHRKGKSTSTNIRKNAKEVRNQKVKDFFEKNNTPKDHMETVQQVLKHLALI